MTLIVLNSFSEFPNFNRAKNWFVKNGTASFGRNIATEISEPPPEVMPNIKVERNRNGPFHLNSDRNFQNFGILGSTHSQYEAQFTLRQRNMKTQLYFYGRAYRPHWRVLANHNENVTKQKV